MRPNAGQNYDRGQMILVEVREKDNSGEALLAQAIDKHNWAPLYQISATDEMAAYFNQIIINLSFNYDQFRGLIRCRQHA